VGGRRVGHRGGDAVQRLRDGNRLGGRAHAAAEADRDRRRLVESDGDAVAALHDRGAVEAHEHVEVAAGVEDVLARSEAAALPRRERSGALARGGHGRVAGGHGEFGGDPGGRGVRWPPESPSPAGRLPVGRANRHLVAGRVRRGQPGSGFLPLNHAVVLYSQRAYISVEEWV